MPQPVPTLAIASAVAAPPAPAGAATAALEQKIRQQAQIIEALISQIDALTTKLAAGGETTPSASMPPAAAAPPTVTPVAPLPAPAPAVTPVGVQPARVSDPEPALIPNAEGVIDLVATNTPKPGEPVNPFTVRVAPSDGVREVTLHVGGIVAGPKICAVVNDRLVQSGDTIESFSVERIEADAVFLRREGQRMRVPVSAQPVRVRMPL